jgi:hypothetical protein
VFIVHETTSELESHNLVDPVICRCRKHRHGATGSTVARSNALPLAPPLALPPVTPFGFEPYLLPFIFLDAALLPPQLAQRLSLAIGSQDPGARPLPVGEANRASHWMMRLSHGFLDTAVYRISMGRPHSMVAPEAWRGRRWASWVAWWFMLQAVLEVGLVG